MRDALEVLRHVWHAAMFGKFGLTEIIVILGIVLLLFGARRLPEIGSGLGRAIRNFKEGITSRDELEAGEKKEEVSEEKSAP